MQICSGCLRLSLILLWLEKIAVHVKLSMLQLKNHWLVCLSVCGTVTLSEWIIYKIYKRGQVIWSAGGVQCELFTKSIKLDTYSSSSNSCSTYHTVNVTAQEPLTWNIIFWPASEWGTMWIVVQCELALQIRLWSYYACASSVLQCNNRVKGPSVTEQKEP